MFTKGKQFGIRLNQPQFDWVKEQADKRGLSCAELIRVLIDEARGTVDMSMEHRLFQHNAYTSAPKCVTKVKQSGARTTKKIRRAV